MTRIIETLSKLTQNHLLVSSNQAEVFLLWEKLQKYSFLGKSNNNSTSCLPLFAESRLRNVILLRVKTWAKMCLHNTGGLNSHRHILKLSVFPKQEKLFTKIKSVDNCFSVPRFTLSKPNMRSFLINRVTASAEKRFNSVKEKILSVFYLTWEKNPLYSLKWTVPDVDRQKDNFTSIEI